jgi:hypothetical protein
MCFAELISQFAECFANSGLWRIQIPKFCTAVSKDQRTAINHLYAVLCVYTCLWDYTGMASHQ